MPNGGAERRARCRMNLALYPSRVRSSDLLGGIFHCHLALKQLAAYRVPRICIHDHYAIPFELPRKHRMRRKCEALLR